MLLVECWQPRTEPDRTRSFQFGKFSARKFLPAANTGQGVEPNRRSGSAQTNTNSNPDETTANAQLREASRAFAESASEMILFGCPHPALGDRKHVVIALCLVDSKQRPVFFDLNHRVMRRDQRLCDDTAVAIGCD